MNNVIDWVQIISTVGFPIVAFMLVYMDLRKKMEELTKAVNNLVEKIDKI